MKKVGQFFMIFLPLIYVIIVQMVVQFFAIGIAVMYMYLQDGTDIMTGMMQCLSNTEFLMILMILYTIVTIITLGMWYYSKCDGDYTIKPKETLHPLKIGGIVIGAFSTQILANLVVALVIMISPKSMEYYEQLSESSGLDSSVTFFMALYVVILGPICEEIIFRGVTFRLCSRVLPFWAANILQAFLFGIFHMNLIQASYATLLGLLLGYVSEKKGGHLYYAIGLHILFNGISTFIVPLLNMNEDNVLIFYGVCFILTIVAFVLYEAGRRIQLKHVKAQITQGHHNYSC